MITLADNPLTVRPAVIIKDEQESTHLKKVIAKLTAHLHAYQQKYPPLPAPEALQLDDLVIKTMSGHLLAPLFAEYEALLSSQKSEISSLRFELQKALDHHRHLQEENEQLLAELTNKNKEYLKFVNDHRDIPTGVSDEEAY
jgi:hypothetical protein